MKRVFTAKGEEENDENEDELEEPADELWICSVDTCRKTATLNQMEFLPKHNIEEGVEMILSCKEGIKEQNYIIQKYLESHHLSSQFHLRLRRDPEWTRSIPFRICKRHFDEEGKPINLPRPALADWRNWGDLLRRESLFYMYGIASKVVYPDKPVDTLHSILAGDKSMSNIMCVIPGCSSNPIVFATGKGFNIHLFPVPVTESLRHQWQESVQDTLDKSFHLPTTGSICEKHFTVQRKGKIVDGKTELPILFEFASREIMAKKSHYSSARNRGAGLPPMQQQLTFMPADLGARDPKAAHCIVRCCPITTQSRKKDGTEYELFMLPSGEIGDTWIKILRKTDYRFTLKATDTPHVCERHFVMTPRYLKSAIPQLFLAPSEAAMARIELAKDLMLNGPEPEEFEEEGPCPCCQDVETCHEILRRFNTKMNTLMQHVNMLCVLEGVKEVVPRPFDDMADDNELYSDPEKVAVLAGVRAASMFITEARSEVNAMNKALSTMGSYASRKECSLYRCLGSKKRCRLVDRSCFESDLESGALFIESEAERKKVRDLLTKRPKVFLCESHWVDHIDNIELEYEDDDEEAKKLKEALAIPMDFQPKYKKRRTNEIEAEDNGEGESLRVKVEVHDDEEEDERLLSNNELLQQLLGGAVPGQVTGEIGDNGEVYEGGEEDAEMEELDNQEVTTEEEREEREEEEEQEQEVIDEEDSNDEPPELE